MNIKYTSLDKIDSFRDALDQVAREKKYLLFTQGPSKESTKDFIEKIIEKGWTQFFALEKDQVVGWCDIIPVERAGIKHVGHLGMGIIKNYRRCGLGTKLLKAALDDAFSKSITRVELDVFASNIGAINLYRKIGFTEEGCKRKARSIDGQFEDILLMGILQEEWSNA